MQEASYSTSGMQKCINADAHGQAKTEQHTEPSTTPMMPRQCHHISHAAATAKQTQAPSQCFLQQAASHQHPPRTSTPRNEVLSPTLSPHVLRPGHSPSVVGAPVLAMTCRTPVSSRVRAAGILLLAISSPRVSACGGVLVGACTSSLLLLPAASSWWRAPSGRSHRSCEGGPCK